jgi:hypothetical protein
MPLRPDVTSDAQIRAAAQEHGCLKTRTLYHEATAWGHRQNLTQSSAAA